MWRALLFVVVIYALWLAFLWISQDRLIFPGAYDRHRSTGFPKPPGAETWWLDTPGGSRTEAWFCTGAGRGADAPGPLLVFAHGNAELIDDQLGLADHYVRLGFSVLLVEYRGFGRSTGRPSERGLVADFAAMLDRALRRPEVDAQRVIYHGRSLGGGVVAQLAARRPPAAMILESTFTSLASMTGRYLAPPSLVRYPFRTDRVVARLDTPLLILHGTRDEVIPIANGRRLHQLAPGSAYVEFDAGHNDFPPDERAYWAVIDAFLGQHGLLPSH